MTPEEIKSKIAEYEKKIANPSLPESGKNAFRKKIEALKSEIKEEKVEAGKDEVNGVEYKNVKGIIQCFDKKTGTLIASIGKKKNSFLVMPTSPSGKSGKFKNLQTAKKAIENQINKKETEKKAEKTPSKKLAKKVKASKPEKDKDKSKFQFKGKAVTQETIEYCKQLVEKWRERKEKSNASGGKKKTQPVMIQVVSRVAQVTKDAIKSVSDAEIKRNPEKAIGKFEKLQGAAENFIKTFKEVLGDKYDAKKLEKEFVEPLTEFIEKLKDKFID